MTDIKKIFDSDPRIERRARVPRGLWRTPTEWPAPRVAIEHYRDGSVERVLARRQARPRPRPQLGRQECQGAAR
jgi:hypothetical protein